MRGKPIWIALASALALSIASIVNASDFAPRALYNPATGGIWFENVIDIVGLRINAPGMLVAGTATDLGGAAAGSFGEVIDEAPDVITWGNLLGMNFDRRFAGHVYPPGTSFDTMLMGSVVTWRPSTAGPTIPPVEVLLIPEPTALPLSSFALACLMLRRWRG